MLFPRQVDVKVARKLKARKVNTAFISGNNRPRCL